MEYEIRADLRKSKKLYHIAGEGEEFSLCGKKVKPDAHPMFVWGYQGDPMFMWGYRGDGYEYCKKCSAEYRKVNK